MTAYIRDADLQFRNSEVQITANRSHPEIKLAGLTIGPLEEGESYQVPLWVALELESEGLARISGNHMLTTTQLHKIHWREKIQSSKGLSALPEGFYPKLRLLLAKAKARATEGPEGVREYQRLLNYSKDIVNCRLRKIVSLASAQVEVSHALRSLTEEELKLYEEVRQLVEEWRNQILGETT